MTTPAGGLDLEVVWVGLGTEADFIGRNVKGKAVMIESVMTPRVSDHSAIWNGAIVRAQEKGAAALIVNMSQFGNWLYQVGSNGAKIPHMTVGNEDGKAIRELLEKGGVVRAKMEIAAEMRSGLKDSNIWGQLPGTTDEDIIVFSHHDGYFQAASDNASGMAVMMALAEHYAKIPQAQRRRTLKFVTTSGHHAGSLGVKWMHDNRDTSGQDGADDQRRACVAPRAVDLGRRDAPHDRHSTAALVRERQRKLRDLAERVQDVRRVDHASDGAGGKRRHGPGLA